MECLNCVAEEGGAFLPKHRFARRRKRLIHNLTVRTTPVKNINGIVTVKSEL